MTSHRFLFLLYHILYLSTYFPVPSLPACIYNESYIYLTTSHYTKYNGIYIRNLTKGIWTWSGTIYPPDCGRPAADYDGTYIYETPSEPTYYLWMSHQSGDSNGLKIGTAPCVPSNVIFETNDAESGPILNGTNCVWSDIDTTGGITWQAKSGDVNGTFELCDATEACSSPDPSTSPTLSPLPTTAQPSEDPTTAEPSKTPTEPTKTPTKVPTKSPTVKPTQLPTYNFSIYVEPDCLAMVVSNLDAAFPSQVAYEEDFNEVPDRIYNQRRVWIGGSGGIEIFYTTRYTPNRWIISNGTYHLLNDGDHLVNGGVNNSFPADSSGDSALYDHFPNDNPYAKAEVKYTIKFECINSTSRHPTRSPTPSPSSSPTLAPSISPSQYPTTAPTIECGTLRWKWKKHNITDDVITDCTETDQFGGNFILFSEQDTTLDNHPWWKNNQYTSDDVLFYSVMFNGWILNHKGFNGNFGDHALFIEAPVGLEIPPPDALWSYFDHGLYFAAQCHVEVEITCAGMLPTRSPVQIDPSPAPTLAPSFSPTYSPSGSPTQPPSVAPSQPPTAAPTGAPTLLCGGLEVEIEYISGESEDYELFRGNYRRQDEDDLKNDRYWWLSRDDANSLIFYSDVVFHNSWVIQSKTAQTYWLYPEYNPYIHVLQPPLSGEWQYYTPLSPFPLDTREISLLCSKSLLPTPAPTAAPSGAPTQPPSTAPSLTPTTAPSTAPSIAPTAAPTYHPTTPAPTGTPTDAPSFAPTTAPTRESCAFMQVNADDPSLTEFNGIYTQDADRNGASSWLLDSNGGVYFIEKTSNGLYWTINNYIGVNGGSISSSDIVTLDNTYNWRPPEYGDWLFWDTRPNPTTAPTEPTSDPTSDPTEEPTLHPTIDPSIDPTMEPTLDPTRDPTSDPTFDPTGDPTSDPTWDPTLEPTVPTGYPTGHPTADPTGDPTMEPTVPTGNPTGDPTQEPTTDPTAEPTPSTDDPTAIPTTEPTSNTAEPTIYPTLEPTTEPTVQPTSMPTAEPTIEPTTEPTLEPTANPITLRRRRALLQDDPPQGTQVYGTPYKIIMDCVNTGSPTVSPTTSQPTMAPTSVCHSIQIEAATNTTISSDILSYMGQYIRSDYEINYHYWFLSYDGLSSLQYLDSSWRIQREDRDDGNDEDTILIYRNDTHPYALKWLLLSPQNEPWYWIKQDTVIYLNIHCLDTVPPTPAPTVSPTLSPTTEVAPIWTQCKQNWFTFINSEAITANKSGVYWDEPIAKGVGVVTVDIMENEYNIKQGDELDDIGTYSILYRATNAYNNNTDALYSDCEISLYIIGDTLYDTLDYCLASSFSVNIDFNETFQEVFIDTDTDTSSDSDDDDDDDTEYEVTHTFSMIGFATNPELMSDNCYIFARKVYNITVIREEVGDTSSFLGIEASSVLWDVLILLTFFCLIGLCIYKLCRGYKQSKDAKAQSESKQEILLSGDLQRERVESAENNDDIDDDIDLDDVNPLNTYGPGASVEQGNKDGEVLLSSEPGRSASGYSPPPMLSEGAGDAIDRNQTAGPDAAIDALLNDNEPVLVTPNPDDAPGGDGLLSQIELQPMDKKQSSFDDGGPLPQEHKSKPVLVTPEDLPMDIAEPNDDDVMHDVGGGLPVPDEDDEDDVAQALIAPQGAPNANDPYQNVADESVPDLSQLADAFMQQPPPKAPMQPRLVSHDEYAELEDDDDDDDDSDDSEFEFRV